MEVGNHLSNLLMKLKEKHSLIGDVRGRGLFLGVELNRDLVTLEPAGTEADRVINEMKERGILLSTDGPGHNVIKIKPPLVFNEENAHFLAETLDHILTRVTKKMNG